MTDHISTLRLHALRYGELSDGEQATVRAHLQACDLCAQRAAAQESERVAFEALPVPVAIREAPPLPANDRRGWLGIAMAIAVAAAVLVAVGIPMSRIDDGSPVHIKGSNARLEAWLDTPEGPEVVRPGDEVSAGDHIQLRVRRPPHPWVTIAGRDGTGAVAIYGSWRALTDTPDWQSAPFSLTLDSTPGNEQLYAIYTRTEPAEDSVRAAIRWGRAPPGGAWDRVILDKQP